MAKHDPNDDISSVDVRPPSSYALRDLDKFCPQNCQDLLVINGSAPLNSDLDSYIPCRLDLHVDDCFHQPIIACSQER
ncbi:hypothetical protein FIBSPDRAFT_953041 [Athelia psychrophila]|uniref:Uncharacterized protein n=1 Tax=Athelia psychrophila TaxID=1759441 RepID=A0A166KRX0_9AGAM|nr:hypothetical protein FIBSPDRAFT_953041 [Fibularhizoctonia sp. CBS 109695]